MNCHLNERSKTMQTCITKIFLLPALIAGLNLIPAGRVTAQTFTVLHSFRPTGPYTNSDGTAPEAVLVLSGDMLYGTASEGGSTGSGTVFAINTNGTGFTVLHSFTALDEYTNIDGSRPNAGVIRSGNTLYGTAYYGGSSGNGTVFAINTDGTGFTVLRSFTATSNSYPYGNSDGAAPSADLIVTNNTLYGTTRFGGASGNGTLFRVNTDGTGFTNLYGFTATTNGTNSDGASPEAGLILSGNTLYGTASGGGGSGMARCSPSTSMARALRICIVSRQLLRILIIPTATELVRLRDWCWRVIRSTGRRVLAAVRALGRCSPSTLMAPGLRTCMISIPAARATELSRMPV